MPKIFSKIPFASSAVDVEYRLLGEDGSVSSRDMDKPILLVPEEQSKWAI
jgi:hypothetical protein